MSREWLKRYYDECGPLKKDDWRRKEHRVFKETLHKELSFLKSLSGKITGETYIAALLNDWESLPKCPICDTTIKKCNNGVVSTFCSKKCMGVHFKKESSVPHPTLDDKEKLKSEYERLGAKDLSDALGVTMRTVHNYMRHHDIPRRGNDNRIDTDTRDILSDRVALKNRYDTVGVDGISEDLGICRGVVYKALDRAGIPKDRGISTPSKDILTCPERLNAIYRDIGTRTAALKLCVNRKTVYNYMKSHDLPRDANENHFESGFCAFLEELGIDFVKNDRNLLDGLEIDFFIPSINLGFELNGLYWHSSKFKNKSYHLDKTKKAESVGIRLIHIFEDEWYGRQIQWKSKIRFLVGKDQQKKIGARSTELAFTVPSAVKDFFNKNHLQGHSGGTQAATLSFEGQIVAAAIFRKNPSDKSSICLNRYATSSHVVGGLSKIMKNIAPHLKEMGYDSVISFADRSISGGGLYEASGWVLDGITPPDYRYVVNNVRVRKQNFRRKKLKRFLGSSFDESLSERKNMEDSGFLRIYDCGLLRYRFDL